MIPDWIKNNEKLYTPTLEHWRYNSSKEEKFVLFYDFSSLLTVDFRTTLEEHLAEYTEYIKENKDDSKDAYYRKRWIEYYPPVVHHFLKTYIDNYDFLRYMLYLYPNSRDKLSVYLITDTEFTEEEKESILKCLKNCYIRTTNLPDTRMEEKLRKIEDILTYISQEKLISDMETILGPKYYTNEPGYYPNTPNYLLISGTDYTSVFDKHAMQPVDEGILVGMNYQRAHYKLFDDDGEYGYADNYENTNPKFYADRIIFLDIDGVLNRDGDDENGNHEFFNENMVKELAYIISRTNAKVILSSSWRGAFINYIHGYKDSHVEFQQFMDLLQRYDIYVYGMTPNGDMRGRLTRPLEIRSWLSLYPEIESFVILDDDIWDWGFLRHNVVTTMTKLTEEEYEERKKIDWCCSKTKDGLTRELADKAVEILLRKNDYCIMDHD